MKRSVAKDAQSFDEHRDGVAERKGEEGKERRCEGESETKHKCLQSTMSLGVDREHSER